LVDIGLIVEAETVVAVSDAIRSSGRLLVCHGCGDLEALIIGFLVIDGDEEAWALCGNCMRKLPISGAVA
jgi:hypothetical protein